MGGSAHRDQDDGDGAGERSKVLTERGRPLLLDVAAIVRELELLGGAETGEIRIGVGPYPAEISVATAAARLLAAKPGVTLDITHGDWPALIADVLQDELDLAICELSRAEGNPRLEVEPLPAHEGFLYCRSGHPLAGRKKVTLDDVRRFPLALTTVPGRLAELVTEESTATCTGLSPAVHVETSSMARTIVLGSDTIGAAVAPQLDDDLESGMAVRLPLELPWLRTHYGFIYLAGRTLAPSLRFLMDAVRAVEHERADRPARRRSVRRRAR